MGGVLSGSSGWRGGKPSTDSLPVVRLTHADRFTMERKAVQLFIDLPDFGVVIYGEREWPVLIATTPLHYGGHRRWLCCLECGSRRQGLYINGERLACRQCLGLRYESQHENRRKREFRATDKLRVGLGWKPGIAIPAGLKPKGMHWNTYWRLRVQVDAKTNAIWGDLPQWIDRFEKSIARRQDRK